MIIRGRSPTPEMPERPPFFDHLAVLADAMRGRLLLALDGRELAVAELCAVLQAPQSTVSRHLRLLADDGWVLSRRDGASRRYRLEPERLSPSARQLWQLASTEVAATPAAVRDRLRLKEVLAERRTRSREFFSSAAGRWDRLRRELFGRHAELAPLFGLLDPDQVVGDLGCGTAAAATALAPFVRRVVAVDASEGMLAAARERLASHPNAEVRRGDLEALPLADGELDAALLLLVLHHVVEPAEVLAEVARTLKPGGRLLLVDMTPHEREEYRREMGHQWLGFAPGQLQRWLAGAGFEAGRRTLLPPDPEARGPVLFALSTRRATAAGAARGSGSVLGDEAEALRSLLADQARAAAAAAEVHDEPSNRDRTLNPKES